MSKTFVGAFLLCCALIGCARAPVQKPPVPTAEAREAVGSVGSNQIIGLDLMSLRDGHGGPQYFPIDGDPIVGQQHLVDLQIYKGASQVTLELLNRHGQLLQSLPLKRTRSADQQDSDKHWGGMLAFPAERVQLVVAGIGADAKPFRLRGDKYDAKTVEIKMAYFPSVIGGRPYEYEIELRNFGPADHFEVTIEDNANFLPATVKQDLALKTDESTTLKVMLNLPVQEQGQIIRDFLFARVIGASQPAKKVSAVAQLSLLSGRDTDADMIGDDRDNCPSLSNAQQLDEDEDGIGDECDPKPKEAAKRHKKKG